MSHFTASGRGAEWASAISSATASQSDCDLEVITTCAPQPAKPSAMARPRPLVAPVTTTTLFANSLYIRTLQSVCPMVVYSLTVWPVTAPGDWARWLCSLTGPGGCVP